MRGWIRATGLALCLGLLGTACQAAPSPAMAPVTVTDDGAAYTLDNGIVTARIDKATGRMRSMTYGGIETMNTGYWSHSPAGRNVTDAVTIDPAANGGERGEVSIKAAAGGQPLGGGPGGSAIADIEIRYLLGRGVSGLYTYSIFTHPADYPRTSIGEARFAVKLNDSVFDWMTVDKNRNMEMITAADWDRGIPMNMKEARLMTTGIMKGQVEHKYDYSANQFETPAYGWSSTNRHVGFWIVNPSDEYLSGGPTKVELSAHRDATFNVGPQYSNDPAPPTLLNYWRGSHYGGSVCDIAQGEAWTKVIGPFLLYVNSGPTHDAMWHDAVAKAAAEAKRWPYDWVQGVDYPHRDQRGTVTGRLTLQDPQAPGLKMTSLLVGLAHPDDTGGAQTVDWQNDAKHYEFWVHGDAQGRFVIPNVRPGTYTLHAIANGVLGEYAKADVTVEAGRPLALGNLTWTPVRYGRQLWDIGVPDRAADEFLHGNDFWHWGLYLQYPKDFPNDVNYVVGKSDYHKDWNYAEVPRAPAGATTGREPGSPTTWTVTFDLPSAPHGKAILRLALTGTARMTLAATVNGQPAGQAQLGYTATINRDSVYGYWTEKDIAFDAALMKAGTNTLKLSIPGGGLTSGVEYDYVRLELAQNATAAVPNGEKEKGN